MTAENMVTVIVSCYGDRGYLPRSLDYWSKSPFQVIVADGSASAYRDHIAANITYLYLPAPAGSNPYAEFARRQLTAISHVTTEFVAQCPDDDFLAFHGVEQVRLFLVAHPHYQCAQGSGPFFKHQASDIIWDFPDLATIAREGAQSDDPVTRLHQIMNPFSGVMYGVYRTSILRAALASIQGMTSLLMIELHLSLVPALRGKVVTLPIFYQAREKVPSVKSPHQRIDKWSRQNGPEFDNWLNTFSNIVHDQYSEISVARAQQIVRDAIRDHVFYLRQQTRRIFVRNVPGWIRHAIRRLIPQPMLKRRQESRAQQNRTDTMPETFLNNLISESELSFQHAVTDFNTIASILHRYEPAKFTR